MNIAVKALWPRKFASILLLQVYRRQNRLVPALIGFCWRYLLCSESTKLISMAIWWDQYTYFISTTAADYMLCWRYVDILNSTTTKEHIVVHYWSLLPYWRTFEDFGNLLLTTIHFQNYYSSYRRELVEFPYCHHCRKGTTFPAFWVMYGSWA